MRVCLCASPANLLFSSLSLSLSLTRFSFENLLFTKEPYWVYTSTRLVEYSVIVPKISAFKTWNGVSEQPATKEVLFQVGCNEFGDWTLCVVRQVKGLQFPGCTDAKYCRLVLHRSKLLMKPVSPPPALFCFQPTNHSPLFLFARCLNSYFVCPFFSARRLAHTWRFIYVFHR